MTDKYYTNSDVVELCGNIIIDNCSIKRKDLIIEPSAGNGAFIPIIKKLSGNYRFYDIEPKHPKIKKADYLSIENPKHNGKIYVIGNPPFGKKMILCKAFIKKSAEFADTIAFILPSTFKKRSKWSCFPLDFRLEKQIDIPKNAFLHNGNPKDINCVFQIWKKHVHPRHRYIRPKPIGFKFVEREDNPDIAVKRITRRGGEIYDPKQLKKISKGKPFYFIKFDSPKYLKIILSVYVRGELFHKNENNTMGKPSLSKDELVRKLNALIKSRKLHK